MDDVRKPTPTTSPLKQLEQFGQSPWLDFIARDFVTDGSLQKLLDEDGLKGMTSNPAIFQKAMGEGTAYDPGFKALAAKADVAAGDLYEALAIEDIQHACDLMLPVYQATAKVDGYVSLEVSPYLALHTKESTDEARRLWKAVGRPNLMVKVPGTEGGVPAIRALIEDGININVTLLFAQSAYKEVAEAFIAGLEARKQAGKPVDGIASVASFFVSRIDSKIDKKIDTAIAKGGAEAELYRKLRGKVAIANAKMAYLHYQELVASPRWKALAEAGAQPQRLLWASTGVKDKAYSDVMYVEELIGRDTVDTIPPATMDAFRDHGTPRDSLTEDLDGARTILAEAERLGLGLDEVTTALVDDGVKQFEDAFDHLLGSVANKRVAMLEGRLVGLEQKLPEALDKEVQATMETWRLEGKGRRIWDRDAAQWTDTDEADWLAWLDVLDRADVDGLRAFAEGMKQDGFQHVLLLGMGGSSLGPEVLEKTFGQRQGWPRLHVLDSTDPQQIKRFEEAVDLPRTLCIVSSKSGSTLEPNILKAYFWDRMCNAVGADKAGRHFVAVTDPGSKLEAEAKADGFRQVFAGDKQIGGRYSVLSNFGLVPAAAMGIDVGQFANAASLMMRSCDRSVPPAANPGIQLGAVLGTLARGGRDKVTIIASPGIADVGAWLEQLLAESTGKQGHGIVPVDDEPLGKPDVYGKDRLFAYLRLSDRPDPAQDAAVKALEAAGQPVVRCAVPDVMAIGQVFYLWEFATAVAGAVIGIDAFNQPDVEASKIETRKLTDAYAKDGSLPAETPFLSADGMALYADATNAAALKADSVEAAIKAHLARAGAGDYVAILAYVDRTEAALATLHGLRGAIRDAKQTATCVGFGPRFLHSTGQTYKGGPNSGVFLQVTADDRADLPVPGAKYSFGVVKAAQARGDLAVLEERGRRALRVHLGADVQAGLDKLAALVRQAL